MSPQSFLAVTSRLSSAACLLTADGHIIAANANAKRFLRHYQENGAMRLHELVRDKGAKVDDLLDRWSKQHSPVTATLTFPCEEDALLRTHCRGSAIEADTESASPWILLELLLDHENNRIAMALEEKTAQAE